MSMTNLSPTIKTYLFLKSMIFSGSALTRESANASIIDVSDVYFQLPFLAVLFSIN